MNSKDYISTIEPKKKWLDVDIKGLWHYRDLYYMNIKRDIVTQYKQTILGPLWYLIQPLFTTIMYMFYSICVALVSGHISTVASLRVAMSLRQTRVCLAKYISPDL